MLQAAYAPEVLRLWMARSFSDYEDSARRLDGRTNHSVWKVRTPEGREAVLKRYDSETERKSFLHEVRTLARMRRYPGVINVDAWFEDSAGGLYLQMPHLPETLKTALTERGGETGSELVARRLRLFRVVLQTLAWLHQAPNAAWLHLQCPGHLSHSPCVPPLARRQGCFTGM